MYDEIGKKIKGLAKAIFIVEAIAAVISGIVLMSTNDDYIVAGLITIICGPLAAWVSSWLIYGFGELIDKACDIEQNTRGNRAVPVETKKKTTAPSRAPAKPAAPYEAKKDTNAAPVPAKTAAPFGAIPAESVMQSKPAETPVMKTLSDHLHYALQYSTVSGMRGYLSRIGKECTAAEQAELESILSTRDYFLQDRIIHSKYYEEDGQE